MFYSCRDPVLFVVVSSHTQFCVEHIVDTQYMLVVLLNHGEGEASQKGFHMKWSFRERTET